MDLEGREKKRPLGSQSLFGEFDYSKNRVTERTLKLLFQLARQAGLGGGIVAMFGGKRINVTENRSVLHVALRAPRGAVIMADGKDVVPEVHAVLDKMAHSPSASETATGRAIPECRSGTSSMLESEAPTSAPSWPMRRSGITATAAHHTRGTHAIALPAGVGAVIPL